MRTKTQLLLLESLQRQSRREKGFTLIELMVVVAIIGVLAAVAIPRYLQARSAAQAGARIGEAVGLAKECSTYIVSQVGSAPTYTATAATCNSSAGTFNGSWTGTVANLRCLTITRVAGSSSVTVGVDSTGVMSCTLG